MCFNNLVHPLPPKPNLTVPLNPAREPLQTKVHGREDYAKGNVPIVDCKFLKGRCLKASKEGCKYYPSEDKLLTREPRHAIGARRKAVTKMRAANAKEAGEEEKRLRQEEEKAEQRRRVRAWMRSEKEIELGEVIEDKEEDVYGGEDEVDEWTSLDEKLVEAIVDGKATSAGIVGPVDVDMTEIEEVEIDPVLQPTASISSPSPFDVPTEGLRAWRVDDGDSTAPKTQDSPPAHKKPKIAKEFWARRPAIFPPEDRVKSPGSRLLQLPNEMLFLVFNDLMPASLIALTHSCTRLYYFLSDAQTNDIWARARNRYADPLPAPDYAIDLGTGVSGSEYQWCRMVLGGGKCEFCHRWTYVPPAGFSLGIYVCLMQECRSHWRKQMKQTSVDIEEGGTYQEIMSDPSPPPSFATTYEGLDEPNDPNLYSGPMVLSPWIEAEPAILAYVSQHESLLKSLRLRSDWEQVSFLQQHIAATQSMDPGDGAQHEEASKAVTKVARKRKAKKPCPYPPFLGEIQSVIWPDSQLKTLVENGMTFIECGPMSFNGAQKLGFAAYERRKYKLRDLNYAIWQWQDSADNGYRAYLIQEWEHRAEVLERKIIVAQQLMRWRDGMKRTLDRIRQQNDSYLREQTKLLHIEWHDASNSPTLVRMRNLSELEYYNLREHTVEYRETEKSPVTVVPVFEAFAAKIQRESKLLNQRRVRREAAGKIRTSRSIARAFHRYCILNMDILNVTVMPPFRIFARMPSVLTLPKEYKELPNWDRFLIHTGKDLGVWEEKVRRDLRRKIATEAALDEYDRMMDNGGNRSMVDWSTSLYRCTGCDQAAEAKTMDALAQAEKARLNGNSKKQRATPPLPKYKSPMTWREVIGHECEDQWDLANFSKDGPAIKLARSACDAIGREPWAMDAVGLIAVGKVWKCTVCAVPLGWQEIHGHCLRHSWEQLHAYEKDQGKVAGELFRKGIHVSLGGKIDEHLTGYIGTYNPPVTHSGCSHVRPVPPVEPVLAKNFLKKLINATHEDRRHTKVECARCYAAAKAGTAVKTKSRRYGQGQSTRKFFSFDGLRAHLKASHKVMEIHTEDIIVHSNALENKPIAPQNNQTVPQNKLTAPPNKQK